MRLASSVCDTPSSFILSRMRRRNAEPILSIAVIVYSPRQIRRAHASSYQPTTQSPSFHQPRHTLLTHSSPPQPARISSTLPPSPVRLMSNSVNHVHQHSEKLFSPVQFADTYSIHSFPPPSRLTQPASSLSIQFIPTHTGHSGLKGSELIDILFVIIFGGYLCNLLGFTPDIITYYARTINCHFEIFSKIMFDFTNYSDLDAFYVID